MRRLTILLLYSSLLMPALVRAEPCRLALVLALDVSGSVDEVEYAQQLNGLSYALNNTEVRATILKDPETPVHLAVFEWSSQNHQFLIQPWTILDSQNAIDAAIDRIRSYRKKRAGLKTALSTALMFAGELLEGKKDCWQKTVDVSGDGKNNIGPPPKRVYELNIFTNVTVNALVVGHPKPEKKGDVGEWLTQNELQRYFEREVIHGSAAFAMIANGYEDYAQAMKRKLIRETTLPVFGHSGYPPR